MSTITAQSLLDFAKIHSKLIPIVGVGGINGEPGLSIINDVLAEVFSAPYNWKFNRVEMPMFVTRQFTQDYLVSGATAFVLEHGTNGGGVAIELKSKNGITQTGTTVTVKTLEPHPFKVGQTVYITGTNSAYDSVYTLSLSGAFTGGYSITVVPDQYSFKFEHTQSGLAPSGAPGITNFGWLESGSLKDIKCTATPQPVMPCQTVKMLDPSSLVDHPIKFAVLSDPGTGVLKLRSYPVPGTYIWGVNLVYQAKAPVIKKLTEMVTPWPDELSYVMRQGVIAKAYRYADQAKYTIEYQTFVNNILRAMGQEDQEDSAYGFVPARPIMLG